MHRDFILSQGKNKMEYLTSFLEYISCVSCLTCYSVEEEEDKYRYFVDEEPVNYMPPEFTPFGQESMYHTPPHSFIEDKDVPLKESFFYTPKPYVIS